MKNSAGRRPYAVVMALALVLGLGAPVGDIGSCGQASDDLDPSTFFDIKAGVDCDRCGDCSLRGPSCDRACHQKSSSLFPAGCRPLVHDGEVCLRALIHASCDDYASYMSESSPTAPSECQFCPAR